MELVYLWVEDYKNIKKQGFNFSPRFECKYDKNTEELTINENEDYVSIFPENINITAIVGENGSGKSSLLVGITNGKIVIKKEESKLFSSHFKDSKCNKKLNEYNSYKEHEIIYLDSDLIKIKPKKNYADYFNLHIYDKNLYKKVENNIAISLDFNIDKFRKNFYNLIVKYRKLFKSNIFIFNPIKIFFKVKMPEVDSKKINKLIEESQKEILSKDNFFVFLYAQINHLGILTNKDRDSLEKSFKKNKETVIKYVKEFELDKLKLYYDFFDTLSKYENNTAFSLESFSTIYNEYKEVILKLIEIGYLQIDFVDCLKRTYFDLSQGERKFFTESLMIYDAIVKTDKDDILLVLDEPDLSLHPDWQKGYIKELLNLLHNFPNKNFHVIITSHSPFILSDLPKENVIFLEKGKQVYPFEDNQQTFGANIHTLLSHGFFMKDGLMGGFAKEKIQNVINFLNNDKSTIQTKKDAWKIIQIVGEPFLKYKLEEMFHENYSSDEVKNEAKIKKLEEEIERLKNVKPKD
ncbi:AAA family ATPase [Halarcobacter sp.]|uniref:AAA family ATPase n=1 Tax=Halarcobacter sp. TaxID=2321133 RepID=UPI0029F57B33|nr:AAA family ATPase [Halarcobacter sp.]